MEQVYLLCMVIPFMLPLPKSFFLGLQRKLGGTRLQDYLFCVSDQSTNECTNESLIMQA